MIPDSEMRLLSGVESSGNSGTYGVKILAYRPPEAQARFDALMVRSNLQNSPEDDVIRHLVPDAYSLLSLLRKQDRMLDPVVKQAARDTKSSIAKAFGNGAIFMEPIENGYWRPEDPWSIGDPWYRVTTTIGHFVVGWRKRVLSVDWKSTVLRSKMDSKLPPSGEEVFPKEEVTRWETGIHAWGYDKLQEYVQTLLEWPVRQE